MFGRTRYPLLITLAALLLAVPATGQDDQGQYVQAEADLVPLVVDAGPRVSLDVQEADIGTVLRSLASFSGTNIVASPRVEGKVTVKLEQVPWREALAVILRAHSFDFIEEHGIIRVDTAEDLRQEKVAVKMA